jgi:hypothetical protein
VLAGVMGGAGAAGPLVPPAGGVYVGSCPGFSTGVDAGATGLDVGAGVVVGEGCVELGSPTLPEQATVAEQSAARTTADRPRARDAACMDHSWWTRPGQSHAQSAGCTVGPH